jgi:DNA primase
VLGSIKVTTHTAVNPLAFAETFYSHPSIQDILYTKTKNRNILYVFKNEDGTIRSGMSVKTMTGWNPVEIHEKNHIATAVKHCGVVEFIPAVNRINQEYPSIITIETDPGDMVTTVLGRKSWIFNTYITEEIMNVLDRYNINYTVKFSGNKGWHIQIPVELREPFTMYQTVVEAIVNKDICSLPDDIQIPAMKVNLMQLEEVRSYKDPFFVARRFVDLVGAAVMFYQLRDIQRVLQFNDLKKLMVRMHPVSREDFLKRHTDLYETNRGPVKVDIPQVLSINPYSKFRRQFKLLIDHSSNKREGKLRSVFSLHSKTGLVSIPALLHTKKGITQFDERMWDYDFLCSRAQPEYVNNQLEGVAPENGYPLLDLAQKWEINYDVTGFEQFLDDHKGLLIYLLQNGGEALELLDTPTALWVNNNLWERTIE